MKYDILASGSEANCLILNDYISLDMGVSYKAIQPFAKNLQLAIIGHVHQDHMRLSTIRTLAKNRPTLRFAVSKWLVKKLYGIVDPSQIDVVEMDTVYYYGLFETYFFSLPHDVPNMGVIITFSDGFRAMYAVDCNSLDHLVGDIYKNCDMYFIGANYCENEIVERVKSKLETGEFVYENRVVNQHLSVQKAEKWLANNAGYNSKFVFLHQHEEKRVNHVRLEDI